MPKMCPSSPSEITLYPFTSFEDAGLVALRFITIRLEEMPARTMLRMAILWCKWCKPLGR